MTAELSAIKKRIFQLESDSKTRDLSLRREYNTKLTQHRHTHTSSLGGGGGLHAITTYGVQIKFNIVKVKLSWIGYNTQENPEPLRLPITIGREHADVTPPDFIHSMSRIHGTIGFDEKGEVTYTDTSKFGTRVKHNNEEKLVELGKEETIELKDNDTLWFPYGLDDHRELKINIHNNLPVIEVGKTYQHKDRYIYIDKITTSVDEKIQIEVKVITAKHDKPRLVTDMDMKMEWLEKLQPCENGEFIEAVKAKKGVEAKKGVTASKNRVSFDPKVIEYPYRE